MIDCIAGIVELFGSWQVGNKKLMGFFINALAYELWIYYSISNNVWGILFFAIPAVFVAFRNIFKWRLDETRSSSMP